VREQWILEQEQPYDRKARSLHQYIWIDRSATIWAMRDETIREVQDRQIYCTTQFFWSHDSRNSINISWDVAKRGSEDKKKPKRLNTEFSGRKQSLKNLKKKALEFE